MLIEPLAGYTRLDGHIEIFRADPQDLVHTGKIDTDTAAQSRHATFQGCSGTERNYRRIGTGAGGDDRRDFLGALDEGDRIRGIDRMIRLVLAMMLTNRRHRTQPLTK